MTMEHKILTLIDQGVTGRTLILQLVGGCCEDELNRLTPNFVVGRTKIRLALSIEGRDRLNALDEKHGTGR